MKKLRLLIGGSPCTFWSIAQSSDKRETEPSGLGWELFKNYLIAKEKFKPHYFLYENNVSASKAIKEQIKKELGVWDGTLLMPDTGVRYIEINSALVSAQNRKRFYVHNIPEVGQPEDRGILLKDILESGTDLSQNEKGYALTTRCQGAIPEDTIQKHRHSMVAEPIMFQEPHGYNKGGIKYDKSPTVTTAAWEQNNKVVEPIRIGTIESDSHTDHDSKQYRVYSPEGKSTTICGQGGGMGAKTGLYACPINDIDGKTRTIKSQYAKTSIANLTYKASYGATMVAETWNGKTYPVYEVRNGLITIKDKQYPIKLPDGYYIIRKLTVKECMRLQTVRDDYIFPVSDTQAYKMLGNGWTVDVIVHILSHIPNIQDYELEVLSLYDGMSCGNLALEKLGCKIARYVSYEIDKYCIKTTQANFPFVEQRGDAFQIRDDNWQY